MCRVAICLVTSVGRKIVVWKVSSEVGFEEFTRLVSASLSPTHWRRSIMSRFFVTALVGLTIALAATTSASAFQCVARSPNGAVGSSAGVLILERARAIALRRCILLLEESSRFLLSCRLLSVSESVGGRCRRPAPLNSVAVLARGLPRGCARTCSIDLLTARASRLHAVWSDSTAVGR